MKISKKTIIAIITTIIVFLIIALIGVYWYNHPTHCFYEDRWIIGKNADQIEQRYGEFDKHFGSSSKGYCVKPSTTDWWGDATWPEYYMVYFDESGKAYKVDVVVGGWGG